MEPVIEHGVSGGVLPAASSASSAAKSTSDKVCRAAEPVKILPGSDETIVVSLPKERFQNKPVVEEKPQSELVAFCVQEVASDRSSSSSSSSSSSPTRALERSSAGTSSERRVAPELTVPAQFQEEVEGLRHKRESLPSQIKRLYFETQGGPTRFSKSKPGEMATVLKELDGSSKKEMLINEYYSLKEFYDQLPSEEQEKYHATFCSLFLKMTNAVISALGSEKERARYVLEQVQALDLGDSFVFSGGSDTHALLYEIKKQVDGRYTFTCFNSGEGADYHLAKGGKLSNLVIKNSTSDQLDAMFVRRLFQGGSIDSIYQHIMTLGSVEYDDSYHYTQGNIGSCALQCSNRWLKKEMPRGLFTSFRTFNLQQLISSVETQTSVSSSLLPQAEWDILKRQAEDLGPTAQRVLVRLHRNILLDSALESACSIENKEMRIKALNEIVHDPEIQKTILDETDEKNVILQITRKLVESGHYHDVLEMPAFSLSVRSNLLLFWQFLKDRDETQVNEVLQHVSVLLDRPENSNSRSLIFLNIVDAFLTFGTFDRALEYANQISDQNCKDIAFSQLAIALCSEGDVDRAIAMAHRLSDEHKRKILSQLIAISLGHNDLANALKICAQIDDVDISSDQLHVCFEHIHTSSDIDSVLTELGKEDSFVQKLVEKHLSELLDKIKRLGSVEQLQAFCRLVSQTRYSDPIVFSLGLSSLKQKVEGDEQQKELVVQEALRFVLFSGRDPCEIFSYCVSVGKNLLTLDQAWVNVLVKVYPKPVLKQALQEVVQLEEAKVQENGFVKF